MDTIFQVLTLSWSLQGGILPDVATSDTAKGVLNAGPMFSVEYGFEVFYPIFTNSKADHNGLYLGTDLRNEFKKTQQGWTFAPIQDTYTFSGGLRWNEMTIGYQHVCTHSIDSLLDGKIFTEKMLGVMDNIFVRLNGKI